MIYGILASNIPDFNNLKWLLHSLRPTPTVAVQLCTNLVPQFPVCTCAVVSIADPRTEECLPVQRML